jgi:hypothetical protein
VRAVLDRLGDPTEIAAEEGARPPEPSRVGFVEIGALVGLRSGSRGSAGSSVSHCSGHRAAGRRTRSWSVRSRGPRPCCSGSSSRSRRPAETGVLFGLAFAPLVAIVYLALRLRD